MCYADVSGGGSGPKNYIPEIKPGESVTIRFAWLVNEDELDKLYLNLRGETVFTDEGLEIGSCDGRIRIQDRNREKGCFAKEAVFFTLKDS